MRQGNHTVNTIETLERGTEFVANCSSARNQRGSLKCEDLAGDDDLRGKWHISFAVKVKLYMS